MWIGWDNQSTPVRIGFQFDQLRKFQLVSIHVNNFVSQGAQVSIQLSPTFYYVLNNIPFTSYTLDKCINVTIKNGSYGVTLPVKVFPILFPLLSKLNASFITSSL